MKNIKYIGFYDTDDNRNENRNFFLSGRNKMDYVIQSLNEINYNVQIISPSWTKNNCFYKTKKKMVSQQNKLILCPTIPRGKYFLKIFSSFLSSLWLFVYLIKYTNKKEKILVYHSLNLIWPVKYAQIIKKFCVILELEEIYSEVWTEKKGYRFSELQYIDSAEGLIVVSDNLENRFKSKAPIILYGAYKVEELAMKKRNIERDIKLVYAGIVDDFNGGAINSVKSMRYLPEQYKLFILGYGSKESLKNLNYEIKKMNSEKGQECCFFLGTKIGTEYTNFLLSCNIALNPQKTGHYMDTAFPSKILTYLSHNLFVVSTQIESIVKSRIAFCINFAQNDKPLEISKAILQVKVNGSRDNSKIINTLHQEFKENIRKILT